MYILHFGLPSHQSVAASSLNHTVFLIRFSLSCLDFVRQSVGVALTFDSIPLYLSRKTFLSVSHRQTCSVEIIHLHLFNLI